MDYLFTSENWNFGKMAVQRVMKRQTNLILTNRNASWHHVENLSGHQMLGKMGLASKQLFIFINSKYI